MSNLIISFLFQSWQRCSFTFTLQFYIFTVLFVVKSIIANISVNLAYQSSRGVIELHKFIERKKKKGEKNTLTELQNFQENIYTKK